jgi:hypothetical protein
MIIKFVETLQICPLFKLLFLLDLSDLCCRAVLDGVLACWTPEYLTSKLHYTESIFLHAGIYECVGYGTGWVGGREGEKTRRHRYTRSSESISYSKEDDPVSGERWVMERRRTGESGEIELFGRENVSGGRI